MYLRGALAGNMLHSCRTLMAIQINKILLSLILIFLSGTLAPVFGQADEIIVNLQMTDRNYVPGGLIRFDFGATNQSQSAKASTIPLEIRDQTGKVVWNNLINIEAGANHPVKLSLMANAPSAGGSYILTINGNNNRFAHPLPAIPFFVTEPAKPKLLAKILVTVPEGETELHHFVEKWAIEAPSISWGQIVLCGKKTWQNYIRGEKETINLIERALRRSMTVIFLDFQPLGANGESATVTLPLSVSASPDSEYEPGEIVQIANKEMLFNMPADQFGQLNGLNGNICHTTGFRVKGNKIDIEPLIKSEKREKVAPVVKIAAQNGNGTIVLCGILTEGRLDESVKKLRNQPELSTYDPVAVQFLLNLIAASVDKNLL